jgi:hypothetical protein
MYNTINKELMTTRIYARQPANLFIVQGQAGPREKFEHPLNETSSIGDTVFAEMRKKRAEPADLAQLKRADHLIDSSEEMIIDHIDKRIALFFQQLIVCYKVPFVFEMGVTQHQAPSAPTLTKTAGGETIKVPFNSAHSATIPCLYAYHKSDHDKWLANPQAHPKPTAFVYLKGSDTYKSHNATIELIKVVNSADISLDGTSQSADQLRIKSIALINQAAKGLLTPQEGLKQFLLEAKRILESRTESPGVKPEIRKILAIYLERVETALDEINDESYFDQLINVTINHEPTEAAKLRKLIYARRFKIIRESQETQSVIAKKIAVLSAEILGVRRRPANFNSVLKKKILSLAQITHNLQGKPHKPAQTLIDSQQHRQKFDVLMRDIRAECRSLTRCEYSYRADVTRDLRYHKRWRQVDLVREYRKVYADGPMSQPTVSRLENTIKVINDLRGRKRILLSRNLYF